ncbi:MAG: hypothetical protein H7A33_01260 [Deltaproteobacteria bacterium]|nr:hypothetical protein [Deltaproteobacteria bacterium]
MNRDPANQEQCYEAVKTKDGSLTFYNQEYGQHYHNQEGALSEAQHVFLNAFQKESGHWPKNLAVLDVGFGLGLNSFVFLNQFFELPLAQDWHWQFHCLEKDPAVLKIKASDDDLKIPGMTIGEQAFKALSCLRQELHYSFAQGGKTLVCDLHLGDAKVVLEKMATQQTQINLILHDPFSPKVNPECWQSDFFRMLSKVCAPGAMLLTYSVARVVKDALSAAGFRVFKRPGFGKKRERLVAIWEGNNS